VVDLGKLKGKDFIPVDFDDYIPEGIADFNYH